MPRDIPIIFSKPMVCALLDGRKTMTRRLAHREFRDSDQRSRMVRYQVEGHNYIGNVVCRKPPSPWQKVEPGDRLWVRECWAGYIEKMDGTTGVPWAHYRATDENDFLPGMKWKPSIHMPRWASRLTLVVTSTKIERLHDISEADAKAEGWTPRPEVSAADPEVHRDAARDWFSDLWTDLHGVESWRSNPEVVALSFNVVRQNIDGIE